MCCSYASRPMIYKHHIYSGHRRTSHEFEGKGALFFLGERVNLLIKTGIGELPRLKTGPHRARSPARDSCGVGTAERLGKVQMDAGVENHKCHPKQSHHLLLAS